MSTLKCIDKKNYDQNNSVNSIQRNLTVCKDLQKKKKQLNIE